MTIETPVELINPLTPSTVVPQKLVLYLPDELPDAPTVTIAVEATSYEPELKRRCTIYREVDLPTAAVKAAFAMENLKVKLVPEAANLLLQAFNYRIATPQS